RLANGFFVRCKCKFRRFTGGKSRNLHAADGGKDIAGRAAELCGVALSVSHPRAFCQEFFMKKGAAVLLAAPSIYF
ncbi:MAG: hypothetical protein MR371_03630, partial [Clostridia bacterium]|nr:hypothetical protein [Clostridia bacterium]